MIPSHEEKKNIEKTPRLPGKDAIFFACDASLYDAFFLLFKPHFFHYAMSRPFLDLRLSLAENKEANYKKQQHFF